MPNRRRAHRRSALVGALLTMALVAAACGSSGSDSKAGPTTTKAGAGPATTAASGEKSDFNQPDSTGEPAAGGSITVGVESRVASLDPAGSLAQPSDIDMALAIYDHLIDYAPDGKLIPSLATKWESTDDLKTWTITIRDDVKFQDGTPFNADAIVKQFERFKDPATNCTCKETVAPISKIEALNPTTVAFTLDLPNAFFSATLAGTLGFIASPTATAKWGKDYSRHPVGTGPFALPNFDSLVLVKNPTYWRKDDKGVQLPYLDKIAVKPIEDARVRLTSLRSGDVDMIQTADTGTIVDVVKSGDKNLKIQKVTGTSSTILMFNTKKPPFNDVRIRLAYGYAIDRAEMNSVQYQGARQESYGPFPPDSAFYTETDYPHFDLAKAKKLVAEAKADGVPTTFSAQCIPTEESRKLMGLAQQQLAAAGLTQNNTFLDQGALVNKVFAKTGDYQVSCFRSGQIANADGLYGSLHTDQASNVTFYSNKEVDKALDDIRATTDDKRQIEDLHIVQKQAAKDLPVISLLFDLFGNIYNTKISGLPAPEPWSLGAITFTTLYLRK